VETAVTVSKEESKAHPIWLAKGDQAATEAKEAMAVAELAAFPWAFCTAVKCLRSTTKPKSLQAKQAMAAMAQFQANPMSVWKSM